ncbi:MAG: sodium/glutamate symporter [bacterium]|jgi:ESS family glutamate:Na+ symporter
MDFEIVDGILNLKLSAMGTLTLASLLLLFGGMIKKRVPAFQKVCLPTAVLGGVPFAVLNLFLWKANIIKIGLDTVNQPDFMNMFFTIVGFGASLAMVKKGGFKLVVYLCITGGLIAGQGFLGMATAKLVGASPLLGIICGPLTLSQGHGYAASFGQMLEDMGHSGSVVVGMAAATFGLVAGSLLGGPSADRLIRRNKIDYSKVGTKASIATDAPVSEHETSKPVGMGNIIVYLALIGSFMTVGSYVGKLLGNTFNVSLPGFMGPLLCAFITRNIIDLVHPIHFDDVLLGKMSDLALSIFLSMALMSLRLWELFDLAIPMIVILVVETLFTLLYVYFIAFRLLGSDFDAAAMSAGLIGHGLGATPNALANMEAVAEKYRFSETAFLIVSLVGAFLQDIFAIPLLVYFTNLFQ